MSTMNEIQTLLSEGKSAQEIISRGFARSTVYAVAKKIKRKDAEKEFEVALDVYKLIDQMAQWIELLMIHANYAGKDSRIPCLYCADKGEEDFMMESKKDGFKCPRCGNTLLKAGQLSRSSTYILVKEAIKRGDRPPE